RSAGPPAPRRRAEGRLDEADRLTRREFVFNLSVKYMSAATGNMSPDHLTSTFAALADPTRRAILARLASGETSVTDLARPFDMSLPAVSKHLKVLEGAGLIARGRDAQWRPCRLEAGRLREVADWVEHYRRFWEESLDRLDDDLKELQSKETRTKEKKHGRKQRKP